MRVKLRKSYNQSRQAKQLEKIGYPTPHDTELDIAEGLEQTITVCSRPSSFGWPISGRRAAFATSSTGIHGVNNSGALDSLTGVNPAFEPPYAHGEAWCDLLYTHNSDAQPSLKDIQSKSKVIQHRFDGYALSASNGGSNRQPYGYNNINKFSMQLSSSINIFGKRRDTSKIYDSNGAIISNQSDTTRIRVSS